RWTWSLLPELARRDGNQVRCTESVNAKLESSLPHPLSVWSSNTCLTNQIPLPDPHKVKGGTKNFRRTVGFPAQSCQSKFQHSERWAWRARRGASRGPVVSDAGFPPSQEGSGCGKCSPLRDVFLVHGA